MKEGLQFSYDGIYSDDMGLYNVSVDTSGMYQESFLSNREIRETSIRGNDKPYFQGVHRAPLSLTLSFAFQDSYNEDKIRAVARWLDQDYYKPFYTLDNTDRIFYCMLNSNPTLVHNGLKQGYVTLEMRCDSPYSYSPQFMSSVYTITNSGTITFTNNGDVNCYPEIWITKVGTGDISIVNTSNKSQEFKFTNILDGEQLYVDNERNYIESTDSIDPYRYSNFNNVYLEMRRGVNNLNVTGSCSIQFRYQFKTLQG